MRARLLNSLNMRLAKRLPERRLFLRSDTETRYMRLSPSTQALAIAGSASIVAWAIVATSVLLMDNIGAGNLREQSKREQFVYEARINALSAERDTRNDEALAAQQRFNAALTQVSQMQSDILQLEEQKQELSKGIEVIQATLRKTMAERDDARADGQRLLAQLEGADNPSATGMSQADLTKTLDFLNLALAQTAEERDEVAVSAVTAAGVIDELELQAKLARQRNDRIFGQLEEAVTVSMAPMDKMFRDAGLPADRIIEQIRAGYNGQGGPLTPLTFSTKGVRPDADTLRANGILRQLDNMNIYRIAAQKAPFTMPVKSAFRYTSGFGPRWGRMHNGTDFAASHGTPIYATGDGVVIKAGWSSGFGKLVKIQHEFGIVTFYAHMSALHVSEGQRVSRGDKIGAMGSTGRSTGTHLHYEVRVGGKPVNPMIFIKAAQDVF